MISETLSFLVFHKSILWIKEEDDTYKPCALPFTFRSRVETRYVDINYNTFLYLLG